jgi:ABC-type sugar transport system substrate-binding protein
VLNNPGSRRVQAGIGLLVAGLALSLAGCGSAANPATSNGTAPQSSGSAAGLSACATEAKARLDSHEGLVDAGMVGPVPTVPVDGKSVAGKRVAILAGSMAVPTIKEKAEAVVKTLALAGVEAQIFDTKIDVKLQAQMMSQAINANFDAIYSIGVLASNVTAGLTAAAEADIPVIMGGAYANDPGVVPAAPNVYAAALTNDVATGKLKADYALWNTDCGGGTGSYAIMSVDYGLFNTISRVEAEEIAELCPGCSSKKYQIDFTTDIVGSSRDNALAAVNQNPNLTAILTSDVWSISQVKPVRQSPNGKTVKFFSDLATTDGLAYVSSGDVLMDVQTNGDGARATWIESDLILRGLTGMDASTGITDMPTALITTDEVGQIPTFDALWEGMKPEYLKLWGLG